MLIGYEMCSTIRFYKQQKAIWLKHGIVAAERGKPSAVAYAVRKADMWERLVGLADRKFRAVYPRYPDSPF